MKDNSSSSWTVTLALVDSHGGRAVTPDPCRIATPPPIPPRRAWSGLRFLLFLIPLFLIRSYPSSAAEVSLLAGSTHSADMEQNTYAWQVDVRYPVHRPFALSASWINEGHLPDHHRDGLAGQIWGEIPLLQDRLLVGFGAGLYWYFDTQTRPAGQHANVHGGAPVYSLSASYRTGTPWVLRFSANHIHPPSEIDTTAFLFGLGYRLWGNGGPEAEGTSAGPDTSPAGTTGTEVTFLLGNNIHNSLESRPGIAGGLEFRRGIARNLDFTLSWVGEDNGEEIRRTGLGGQLWIVDDFLKRRLVLGIGAGPYPFLDGRSPEGGHARLDFAILVTMTAGYRFTERWIGRFHWNRVATRDNRDSDMFLLGIGYRWNR